MFSIKIEVDGKEVRLFCHGICWIHARRNFCELINYATHKDGTPITDMVKNSWEQNIKDSKELIEDITGCLNVYNEQVRKCISNSKLDIVKQKNRHELPLINAIFDIVVQDSIYICLNNNVLFEVYIMKASFYTTESDIIDFLDNTRNKYTCENFMQIYSQKETTSKRPDFTKLVDYFRKQKLNGEVLNVDTIKSLVFPQSKFDFFVSHYHKNYENSIKFSDKLNCSLNFSSFIDSQFWENVNNLYQFYEQTFFKEIHNEDKKEQMELWTNISMILVSSLMDMIYSTDYFIFIDEKDNFNNIGKSIDVFSPWVHLELMCSNLFKVQSDFLPAMESLKTLRNLNYTTRHDNIIKVTSKNLISAYNFAVKQDSFLDKRKKCFVSQLLRSCNQR